MPKSLLERINFPESFPSNFKLKLIKETHISIVLIGEQQTFKFKKAVKFDFIDHHNISNRWKSAVKEIKLNQRLSKGIYQGLMIFTRQASGEFATEFLIEFEEHKVPVDLDEVAVVMSTIPEETQLDWLIREDRVRVDLHILPLAEALATFHLKQLEAGDFKKLNADDFLVQFKHAAADNIRELEVLKQGVIGSGICRALEGIQAFNTKILEDLEQVLIERCKTGYVIDAHGDLRAEHVCYYSNQVSIIDCVEFNDSLRTIDLFNDIAFLRMDLHRLKRGDLWEIFYSHYLKQLKQRGKNGDIGINTEWITILLDLYSSYRAMVRAKVLVLKNQTAAEQFFENGSFLSTESNKLLSDQEQIASFVSLASRYRLGLGNPFAVIICGLMGVGKTTLARFISDLTGAQLFSSDVVRKELFGFSTEDKSLGFGRGKYSPQASNLTYRKLYEEVEGAIRYRNPVIIDASFARISDRKLFSDLCLLHKVSFLFVLCSLTKEQTTIRLLERVKNKDAVSDGRIELLEDQLEKFEPFTLDETHSMLEIDTAKSLREQSDIVLKAIGANL